VDALSFLGKALSTAGFKATKALAAASRLVADLVDTSTILARLYDRSERVSSARKAILHKINIHRINAGASAPTCAFGIVTNHVRQQPSAVRSTQLDEGLPINKIAKLCSARHPRASVLRHWVFRKEVCQRAARAYINK